VSYSASNWWELAFAWGFADRVSIWAEVANSYSTPRAISNSGQSSLILGMFAYFLIGKCHSVFKGSIQNRRRYSCPLVYTRNLFQEPLC
jgi:hypothetical protein